MSPLCSNYFYYCLPVTNVTTVFLCPKYYDITQVASLFSDFNEHYSNLEKVFQDVTKQVFKPGKEQIVLEKLRAEVKPVKKDDLPFLGVSDRDRAGTNRFLQKKNLENLQKTFINKGVVLSDLFDMTEDEMVSVGVTSFSVRKQLKVAVEALLHQSSSASGQAGRAPRAGAREGQAGAQRRAGGLLVRESVYPSVSFRATPLPPAGLYRMDYLIQWQS